MSSLSQALRAGALAGAVAGAATGVADGLWSFTALSQYLPSLGGKLTLFLHLAFSYGLAMMVVGGCASLFLHVLSQTAAPGALRSICHGTARANASRSLALVAPPLWVAASCAGYQVAFQNLVMRKHPQLVVAVSIFVALVSLALAVVAAFLAASAVERLLKNRLGTESSKFAWALGLATTVVSLLVAYMAFRLRFKGVPAQTLALAGAAIACPLAAASLGPLALARIDGDRRRELALPLVLTAVPLAALGVGVAFKLGSGNSGVAPALLIAKSMSMAIIALVLGLSLGVFLARVLETPLRRFASPHAPLVAAGAGGAIAGTAVVVLSWKTLSLLPLRPFVVGAALLSVGHVLRQPLTSLARRIPLWAFVLALPSMFTAVVLSGAPESVQKAQGMHAGLGEPLAQLYRRLGDWDRDGSSRWLGGGDCDDSDPSVHPRADEIPFDGIDNNCLRGDVTKRDPGATHFALVPPGLPKDFNVLFLTIDTIRADHLGAYGYERNTTPRIDALAADGTLFANGWAHAPSTRYSIPAILTGRHPLNVRYKNIPGQWPGLDEGNTTIAEIMQGRGLHTGAILNYWYFDTHRKMNQGFAHYDNSNKRLHKAVRGKGPAKTSGSSSKEQSDKAIEYIETHAHERFFLWVHYYDPHYDYEKHQGTPEFGDGAQASYDHEIAYTDTHIGRVIDDLRARGLYEKTVVVLTGDHGEGFGEHGINLHGYHLYAAQTKVPFIIRVPGVAPSVVDMPASHVDILPTLANMAGAKSSSEMLGRSLLGVISGDEDPKQERYVFQQLSYENNNEYRGAISSKCHVLYNVSPSRSWELYKIDTDPMETRDIINSPGECAGAREALEIWYDYSEIPEGASAALLPTRPDIPAPLSIKFGKSISLLEMKLAKTIRRGHSETMELTWQALGTPPKGWKVFAHFERSPGQTPNTGRFTADHTPPRPLSWWRKGQFIRYGHEVSTARNLPLGHYDLWLGMYRGNDRMKVTAAGLEIDERRVKLGTFRVIP